MQCRQPQSYMYTRSEFHRDHGHGSWTFLLIGHNALFVIQMQNYCVTWGHPVSQRITFLDTVFPNPALYLCMVLALVPLKNVSIDILLEWKHL